VRHSTSIYNHKNNQVLRRPLESGQYLSHDFQQVLDDQRVLASIGSVGDAYDNAMAESFVDTFKTELIADRVFRSHRELELAIVAWVAWYNQERLCEAIGDIPPAEYEQHHYAAQNTAA
jgi:putative transposase